MPDYKTNDPKGWGGDPRRGAALGRGEIHKAPRDIVAKFTLRHVPLNNGGYDENGTYFGTGAPLYWYALADAEGNELVDSMLRAGDRDAAKRKVREKYPNAQFFDEKKKA